MLYIHKYILGYIPRYIRVYSGASPLLHPIIITTLLLLQDLLLLKPVVGVLTCGQQEIRLRLERGEVGHADT